MVLVIFRRLLAVEGHGVAFEEGSNAYEPTNTGLCATGHFTAKCKVEFLAQRLNL